MKWFLSFLLALIVVLLFSAESHARILRRPRATAILAVPVQTYAPRFVAPRFYAPPRLQLDLAPVPRYYAPRLQLDLAPARYYAPRAPRTFIGADGRLYFID